MTPDQYNSQIMATLLQLQRDVSAIKDAVLRGVPATSGAPAQSSSAPKDGVVADDRDLDGDHGDPTIKYDPKEKYWSGASYVGYHFSETDPEYLDAMARYLDACAYMADKETDEKKRKSAIYKRKDAARARGWAKRLRAQGVVGGATAARAPAPSADDDGRGGGFGNDDLPF